MRHCLRRYSDDIDGAGPDRKPGPVSFYVSSSLGADGDGDGSHLPDPVSCRLAEAVDDANAARVRRTDGNSAVERRSDRHAVGRTRRLDVEDPP